MPFFRCSIGGGSNISQGLADLNDLLNTLGENEYLFADFSSNRYRPVKKTLSSEQTSLSAAMEGVLMFDTSKITFSKLAFTNTNANFRTMFIKKYQGATQFHTGGVLNPYDLTDIDLLIIVINANSGTQNFTINGQD